MEIGFTNESFATRLGRLMGEGRHRVRLEEVAVIAAGKGRKPVSKQAVSKWVSGAAMPDAVSVANLAKHWNISKEWLFFGDSPKQRISIDIAKAIDLIPDAERQEVARDVARRLDDLRDVSMGQGHDAFVSQLHNASLTLKKLSKPSH